jgi:hypothetical protein
MMFLMLDLQQCSPHLHSISIAVDQAAMTEESVNICVARLPAPVSIHVCEVCCCCCHLFSGLGVGGPLGGRDAQQPGP